MNPSGIFLQDSSSLGLKLAFLKTAGVMFKVKCLQITRLMAQVCSWSLDYSLPFLGILE